MTYYRVPAALSDTPCYSAKTRQPNGYYLIANELLTAAECRKINAPIARLERVEIKKSACSSAFGARFAKQ